MEEQKFSQLENRSLSDVMAQEMEKRAMPFALRDTIRKLEAREIIHAQIEDMRKNGEALTLSDEEIKLLESFRRFKLRMRKNGEVFTWQTSKPVGVQLVSETAEIVHPNER